VKKEKKGEKRNFTALGKGPFLRRDWGREGLIFFG